MTLKKSHLICALAFTTLISCTNQTEEKNTTDELTDSLNVPTDSLAAIEEESDVSYNLPSALQIAYVAKKSGATYNVDFLNKTENAPKYNTSNYKRAVNFGIYSSDLANCVFNKKYQESKQYLKALKEMGSYLGLNQAFESDNLAERFDKNLTNEDTLVKIVSNVQLKTDELFEHNKQKHITVIAFAGAWVESLNLANESYLKQKNKKVLMGMFEQILFAPTLISALEANKTKEPEIEGLLKSIKSINEKFNAIPAVKSTLDKEEELDFSTMNFTDSEVESITKLVKDLRTEMVN